jgi:hypothetical protein
MTDQPEYVARVGLAGWIGESDDEWDPPPVLGVLGEDLCLVELDASNRERILLELVERFDVADPVVRIELVFFGDAGGFFASSMRFLPLWPKSAQELPAEALVDERYRATFVEAEGEVVISVRHALRPDAPPRRQLRFHASAYQDTIAELALASTRLRDELIAVAEQRAPEKVASLLRAFELMTIASR